MIRNFRDKTVTRTDAYTPTFVSDHVNGVVYNALKLCFNEGSRSDSRNGEVASIEDANMIFTDPRGRHLDLPGRTSNIFQLIGETFWVMAGRDDIKDYLELFIPRAPQYSDNGRTWHGAYGKRLLDASNNQLQGALELLRANKDERRAYVSIYDPNKDSPASLRAQGIDSPKDVPCNDGIFFWIRDNHLKMKVVQRSGDLIFGAGSINPFEFSFIHETMYYLLKQTYPDLVMGDYRHNTINLHIYMTDDIKAQTKNILGSDCGRKEPFSYWNGCGEVEDLVYPAHVQNWEDIVELFNDFVSECVDFIRSKKLDDLNSIIETVNQYKLELGETSLLVRYFEYTLRYIVQKVDPTLTLELPHCVVKEHNDCIPKYDLDLAVYHSKFRKFKMNVEI